MLANELVLAGVRPTVVEALLEPTGQSRALNLHPRTAEILDSRGLLEPLQKHPIHLGFLTRSFFAGIPVPLDCGPFGSPYPQQVGVLQSRVEAMLEKHLGDHGVTVARGSELVGLDQDADGVTAVVETSEGQTRLRARYLVACDGSRSTVRKLLGLAFPGTDGGPHSRVAADVILARPPEEWFEEVPEEHRRHLNLLPDVGLTGVITLGKGGRETQFSLVGLEDDIHRLMFSNPDQPIARDAPITEQEVRDVLHAVGGPAAELKKLLWSSRFTDACRQIDRYRVDRVLLAGDAAHIVFPIGGQGMNLGLQDAHNLGWKLAAEVQGRAPAGLLDTYHDERHPVSARILGSARAQAALLDRERDVSALREVLGTLLELPEANQHLAGLTSGLSIRYEMVPEGAAEAGAGNGSGPGNGSGHPLVGLRMPDLALSVDGAPVRTSQLARSGTGLLLELDGTRRLPAPTPERIDHVVAAVDPTGPDPDFRAVLVRPDGYVCWAARDGDDADGRGLAAALTRWFGAPAAPASA
ncbi:hypothetical protein ADK64_28575 [Streptomyces sp. MMG1121]|nr:hypothetical protein ADK64_28575 [Streptomyces sp. MMG1121]